MPSDPYGAWCGDHWESRWDRLQTGDRTVGAWMDPTGERPICDEPGCGKAAYMVFEPFGEEKFALPPELHGSGARAADQEAPDAE